MTPENAYLPAHAVIASLTPHQRTKLTDQLCDSDANLVTAMAKEADRGNAILAGALFAIRHRDFAPYVASYDAFPLFAALTLYRAEQQIPDEAPHGIIGEMFALSAAALWKAGLLAEPDSASAQGQLYGLLSRALAWREGWLEAVTVATQLDMYTVYEHPAEHPHGYIVRHWLITAGEPRRGRAQTFDTLQAARESLPPGLARLPRSPGDVPQILESWV